MANDPARATASDLTPIPRAAQPSWCLDPHAGFLLARGIKTLALRVKAQNENALALAGFLAGHQDVAAVNYPGLASHPDHQHAARLLSGFGGMLSLRLHGGEPAARALTDAVRLPFAAPSLGGVETLITLVKARG